MIDTLVPRALRAKSRVSAFDLATRLGITLADLQALERLPLSLWECRDAARYVVALGYTFRIIVIGRDGRETELV